MTCFINLFSEMINGGQNYNMNIVRRKSYLESKNRLTLKFNQSKTVR